MKLEAKQLAKLEQDLLSFLLVASFEGDKMFPSLFAIAKQIKRLIDNRPDATKDVDFEIRKDELTKALFDCGIPQWVARRNAAAFMVLRPDFDLKSPKHRRIKQLLDQHQEEFLDAYFSIAEKQGQGAADAWMQYIRQNDIFFARIVSLPDGFDSKYLFGC